MRARKDVSQTRTQLSRFDPQKMRMAHSSMIPAKNGQVATAATAAACPCGVWKRLDRRVYSAVISENSEERRRRSHNIRLPQARTFEPFHLERKSGGNSQIGVEQIRSSKLIYLHYLNENIIRLMIYEYIFFKSIKQMVTIHFLLESRMWSLVCYADPTFLDFCI